MVLFSYKSYKKWGKEKKKIISGVLTLSVAVMIIWTRLDNLWFVFNICFDSTEGKDFLKFSIYCYLKEDIGDVLCLHLTQWFVCKQN